MMDALAILCILIDAAIIAFFYRITHREKENTIDFFNSRKLEEEVHELNSKMNRLEQIDHMLIDLNLCSPAETLRAFRMEWQSVSGDNHAFDILADGKSDSSEQLRELMETEREQLNAEIAQRILHLYQRACKLSFYDEIPG